MIDGLTSVSEPSESALHIAEGHIICCCNWTPAKGKSTVDLWIGSTAPLGDISQLASFSGITSNQLHVIVLRLRHFIDIILTFFEKSGKARWPH